MTPDERAARAERVIEETIEQLLELSSYFTGDGTASGAAAVHALELAGSVLARNARIAGIDAPALKNGS